MSERPGPPVPELNDPNFTFVGPFLRPPMQAPEDAWIDELRGQQPGDGIIPVTCISGSPYNFGYEPFQRSPHILGVGGNWPVTAIMNEILGSPVLDGNAIETRREIMSELAGSNVLRRIAAAIYDADKLAGSLKGLFVPVSEDDYDQCAQAPIAALLLGQPTVFAPGPRRDGTGLEYKTFQTRDIINPLLSNARRNADSFLVIADLLGQTGPQVGKYAKALHHLGSSIRTTLEDLGHFTHTDAPTDGGDTSSLETLCDSYLSGLKGYGLPSRRYHLNPDHGNFSRAPGEWVGNVGAIINEMSAVVTLACMAHDDGWQRVTLGPDTPLCATWKFQRAKESQTPGDGLFNQHPVVILTAPNGSGKTFATERDFGALLARQTLGYTPATSPNSFSPFTSFHSLGRCSEEGSGNHGALEGELRRIRAALENMGEHPVFYFDEPLSTTSPIGQAAVVLAIAQYIQENNGCVSIATHNELIAQIANEILHAGLYTFTNDAQNPHRMIEGVADSGFSEIVRKAGLDDIAEGMHAYLAGQLAISFAPSYPALQEGYSQATRERLMNTPDELAYLFPDTVHSPAFVPLSDDSGLIRGSSPEHTALLYVSDPVHTQELAERRRTIAALAGYSELATLRDDLEIVRTDYEPFAREAQSKSPITLLLQLCPVDLTIGEDQKPIVTDFTYIEKTGAYVRLLQLLHPNEHLEDLERQLSELSQQALHLQQKHQATVRLSKPITHHERTEADKQFQDSIKEILQATAENASRRLKDFTFAENIPDRFWAKEEMRRELARIASPSMRFDDSIHDYCPPRFRASGRTEPQLSAMLIDLKAGCETLASILLSEPMVTAAITRLEQHADIIDSVHVRQGIGHIRRLVASGPTMPSSAGLSTQPRPAWHSEYSPLTANRSRKSPTLADHNDKRSNLVKTTDRLMYLVGLAERVSSGEYALAEFNTTGEIRLDSIKDLSSSPRHQPFDYTLGTDQAGAMLSGDNSSGKTYSAIHVVDALLLALKTGVVPAQCLTLSRWHTLVEPLKRWTRH